MTEEQRNLLNDLHDVEYCYLTTTGRVTGKPHDIEIWFGAQNNSIYLMAGGGRGADWVKNLLKDPHVSVRIGKQHFTGTARLVQDIQEEMAARFMLAEKYNEWENEKTLSEWAHTALVVAIELKEG